MSTSVEPWTVMGFTLTTVVFLAGFVSVRIHAHIDRAVARVEALTDTAIAIARDLGSFPRPIELLRILDNFETPLDRAAWLTLGLCVIAWLFGLTYAVYTAHVAATFNAAVAATGFCILLTGVVAVMVTDFRGTMRSLSKERSHSAPAMYREANDLLAGHSLDPQWLRHGLAKLVPISLWLRVPEAVLVAFGIPTDCVLITHFGDLRKRFGAIVDKMPHWPWAKVGMARACRRLCELAPDDPVNQEWIDYLYTSIKQEIYLESKDPIDQLLLAAAHCTNNKYAEAAYSKLPTAGYLQEYQDLRELDKWVREQIAKHGPRADAQLSVAPGRPE